MANKRAKSLKSMTVSELVKERQKHSDRINKIDEILQEATKALGQRVVEQPIYQSAPSRVDDFSSDASVRQGSIGATPIPSNRKPPTLTAPVSLHPPSINPIGYGTKDDIAPAFSLFDADADARLRAPEEAAREDQANGDYVQAVDNNQLEKEASDLRQQLAQELNNINDIPVPEPTKKQPEEG